MTPLIRKLLGMNWILVATMLALSIFGVFAVYSATFFRPVDYWQLRETYPGLYSPLSYDKNPYVPASTALTASPTGSVFQLDPSFLKDLPRMTGEKPQQK